MSVIISIGLVHEPDHAPISAALREALRYELRRVQGLHVVFIGEGIGVWDGRTEPAITAIYSASAGAEHVFGRALRDGDVFPELRSLREYQAGVRLRAYLRAYLSATGQESVAVTTGEPVFLTR